VTRQVSYQHGDTPLTGVLHWTDEARPRPGLLLVHGGAGRDQHAIEQAERFARLGLTVFALDMYGDGVAGDRDRVMETLGALRADRDLLVARASAGLAILSGSAEASRPVAVVGYCFGGMVALEVARAGVEIDGVISIHGSLATTHAAQPGSVRARVLALHGVLDPHVPMTQVHAFSDEMTAAGVDWQVNLYGGAMHGFTHRHAIAGAMPGVEYHATTDRRSFAAASEFLSELAREHRE
jgi:dienelactone hydrolase